MPLMDAPRSTVAHLEQSLFKAQSTISRHYDEVFLEVHQRISAVGSAGKADKVELELADNLRSSTAGTRC